MSDPLDAPDPPPPPPPVKENPEALVLRGRPRPAVRFRRGLIIGITGAVAASLVTLSWLALEPPSFRKAAEAVDSGEPAAGAGADALASLPKSYGDVPRLGPPLPGDLGRPILEHQRSLDAVPPRSLDMGAAGAERAQAAAEAERERLAAAKAAARSSPVIVQLTGGAGPSNAAPSSPALPVEAGDAASASPVPAAQQRKLDFARSSDGTTNPHGLQEAASPWMLSAGTVIPASLTTGLNSDLPGMVLAQVTENVRDSATGRTVLIPQGARLMGRYDSVVSYGQRRALVVWTRILFPDGSSVDLDNMPAADVSGYAGLRDGVDSHTWQLLKGIALSTLLGVGTQLSLGSSESDLVRAIRESAQQNASNAGNQITSRNLDIQPTLTVRPGWPVRAILNKDLVLQPWRA
ncbi:MAG: TrbI/VirB10 family protein [Pseudomonadota bacterium]